MMNETTLKRASCTSAPSFFVAGVMQGSRRGADLAQQDYRQALRARILERHPDAIVRDPGEIMWREMTHSRDSIRRDHAALISSTSWRQADLSPPLTELVGMFHRLVDLAAESDVCVAWLPDHEPSMGTAAEMFGAYRAGRTVVAITSMRQNLAVLACSTIILPDGEAFSRWLETAPIGNASYAERS
jgi:hypothetical protein